MLRFVFLTTVAFVLAACATQAQMQAQVISHNTTASVNQFQACIDGIAASPKYAPIRAKMPLDARKATLAQLTETSRITPAERAAVLQTYDSLQACRQNLLSNIERATPTLVPILADAYARNDMLLVQLLEGKITWGEELQMAKALSVEAGARLTAEAQRIDAGLQQSHAAELQRRQAAANALAAYAQQQQVIDAMNRPVQVNVHQQPTATTCRKVGNSINCTTQ